MTFGVDDFHDLIRLLETRPEWRVEVRRLVLSDELLALPEQIALFRANTEQRFQELLEAQKHTNARLVTIDERWDALADAQNRTDTQIARLTQSVQALTDHMKAQGNIIGDLKGELLELRYRERAPAYVGRLVRRAQVLSAAELVELLETAVEQGRLTEAEKDEVLLIDLVVRGKRKEDGVQVYLAVEVSWSVGPHDVERAAQRATPLGKLGIPTAPVVAGRNITTYADELARVKQVQPIIRSE